MPNAFLLQLVSYAPDYVVRLAFTAVSVPRNGRYGERQGRSARSLRNSWGAYENSVQTYIDLFSDDDKKQAAVENLMSWQRSDAPGQAVASYGMGVESCWRPPVPGQRPGFCLQELIDNRPAYSMEGIRIDRTLAAFNCSAETQAMYKASGLPELAVPYPCEGLVD